jgi:hypothetical protein
MAKDVLSRRLAVIVAAEALAKAFAPSAVIWHEAAYGVQHC